MDKAEFNAELEALLPYLDSRKISHRPEEPRLLLSSDMLDNPQFLELIESEGCVIVTDDMDTGRRYFQGLIDPYAPDPIAAIARRYCSKPADPIAFNWEEQSLQIVGWAKEFRVDGVLELFEEFSPARQWRSPIMSRQMARAGIPFARISRGYSVSNIGQMRTRTAAFLEMLDFTPASGK
jgi:benzoyl-CoA reductase/2-hydroxyglutaryl-CoA dehydratase subunit BcrC/BadD/HgdB